MFRAEAFGTVIFVITWGIIMYFGIRILMLVIKILEKKSK